MNTNALLGLDYFYAQVEQVLLRRQDPLSGMFPASTTVTVHGDYTDAWVRDNVYSIQAVFALSRAYRKAGTNNSRAYLLEQTVVKLMRGLLLSMMRQSAKVERFKVTQNPLDALHAKYDSKSGNTIVADDKWGHLQLDATSLYLLTLAQMIGVGLRIIFTMDEVNFVQNLVHYIGRAYRTPDYGIWERGHKINNGRPEINASSVGMAKAALEAMHGLNAFGVEGDAQSLIHVVPDEIARCRAVLNALLPRESLSKEVDAALLSVVSFPAFAVDDPALAQRTRQRVVELLAGRYGLKRFLLDGHQTVLEDQTRLHYQDDELKNFSSIESEWPLFYTYLLLDAEFNRDKDRSRFYQNKLAQLCVEQNGFALLPELYYVAAQHIDAEKNEPGSQPRVANANLPLVWAQSLYMVGLMLAEGLIAPEDIDPCCRGTRHVKKHLPCVGISFVAHDLDVCAQLEQSGVCATPLTDVTEVKVAHAKSLAKVLRYLGRNLKLGLTGRPYRRLRSLSTSQIYQIGMQRYVFLSPLQNAQSFYLAADLRLFVQQFKAELSYVARHWQGNEPPLMVFYVTQAMLDANDLSHWQAVLSEIAKGEVDGYRVQAMNLHEALKTVTITELAIADDVPVITLNEEEASRSYQLAFDPLQNRVTSRCAYSSLAQSEPADAEKSPEVLREQLLESPLLPRQLQILQELIKREGLRTDSKIRPDNPLSYNKLLEELYDKACDCQHWSVVRSAAAMLNKIHAGLEDAVAELVSRQRHVVIGRAVADYTVIETPLSNEQIHELIRTHSGQDAREYLINQEVLVNLASLIRGNPVLLKDLLSFRVGHFVLLLVGQIVDIQHVTQDEAFDLLCSLPPSELYERLQLILDAYQDSLAALHRSEKLHYLHNDNVVTDLHFTEQNDPFRGEDVRDWRVWREHAGVLTRLPETFHLGLWSLLKHCKGLVLGDRYAAQNRLDSSMVHDAMTSGEAAFARTVEHMLNDMPDPAYRQLSLETLLVLIAFAQRNPHLQLSEHIVLDTLLSHAVHLDFVARFPEQESRYNELRGQAWREFYLRPPHAVANAVVRAMRYLMDA